MSQNESTKQLTAISYGNLEILSPYQIINFQELTIEKKINEHGRIYFKGIIPEEKKDSYIINSSFEDIIEVKQTDSRSVVSNLFKGIVTRIAVKVVQGIYYLEVEGSSGTLKMDIKKKKRSFQNEEMPFTGLIEKVTADYPGSDFFDAASGGNKLEKFILQYEETDWEFLKRMASRFNTGLVPDCSSSKPKFWFGIPEGEYRGKLDEFHYHTGKSNFKPAFDNKNHNNPAVFGQYYEVETDQLLNIGDRIGYNDRTLTVVQSTISINNGILRHLYILTPGNGADFSIIPNYRACMNSLKGMVIGINEDKLRLHLDIDKEQEVNEAYWFPYSAYFTSEGSTGLYCMPELNDEVILYFPTDNEENGMVINSIRANPKSRDKIGNPDIKYFRTRFGKEEKYTNNDLTISAKDDKVLIKLDKTKGVEIHSDNDIQIKSGIDTILKARKIKMTAGEKIELICEKSSIIMEENIYVKGTNVKVRCR